MAGNGTSTGYVRLHLRNNLPQELTADLFIWTSPGGIGRGFTTTVRRSDRPGAVPWTSERCAALMGCLEQIDGAAVEKIPRADRLLVVWPGH